MLNSVVILRAIGVGILSLSTWGQFTTTSVAQMMIRPDTTLGSENSVPNVQGNTTFIEEGATRGINLFHSFEEFNIDEGNAAYFLIKNETIENIFSRITGNDPSDILGILGTCLSSACPNAKTDANLYFMNPNGILFGPDSRLDVGGSFIATTADSIQFGQQGFFSATAQNIPSQSLTINPSALFFNSVRSQQGIINQSRAFGLNGETNFIDDPVGLQVPDGASLILLGGNITLDNGNLTAKGGKIEIGSVWSPGEVGLTQSTNGLTLDYASINSFGDVLLENMAAVDVTAGNTGGINVHARNITLDNSFLLAGIDSNLGAMDAQAGEIIIDATGIVSLSESFIVNNVWSGVIGNSGGVAISTGSLSVNNGAQIQARIVGTGTTGKVRINARESVSFDGRNDNNSPSGIFTGLSVGAEGATGGVDIAAESLSITNRAQFSSSTSGRGNPGDIVINTEDNLFLLNSIIIAEVTEGFGIGNGGDINITTGSLELINGSALLADAENQGDAGNIIISARDAVVLAGEGPSSLNPDNIIPSQISTTVEPAAVGEGGDISITADLLSVIDGGFIRTSTFGEGNAGDIGITANEVLFRDDVLLGSNTAGMGDSGNISMQVRDRLTLLNSLILAEVSGGSGNGKGGDINITTGSLALLNGSSLLADTENQGDAGNIIISARDAVVLAGEGPSSLNPDNIIPSQISTTVESAAVGEGGDISITADLLSMTDRGFINASTFGQGVAGNIDIKIDRLEASEGSQILVQTFGDENSGQISIVAQEAISFRGRGRNDAPSGVFATVAEGAGGNGGKITITTVDLTLEDRAIISARSDGTGDAGIIDINSSNELRLVNSDIVTEAPRSSGGDIRINTSSNDANRGISILQSSDITTNSQGDGGNITFLGPIVAFNDSDILARSRDARGGNIVLGLFFSDIIPPDNQEPFDGDGRVDINADGQISSGNITTTDTSFVQNSLDELPDTLIHPENLVASSCIVRSDEQGGTFVITSADGLPEQPITTTTTYETGIINTIDTSEAETSAWRLGEDIVEPQAVYQLADGRLVMSQQCESGFRMDTP